MNEISQDRALPAEAAPAPAPSPGAPLAEPPLTFSQAEASLANAEADLYRAHFEMAAIGLAIVDAQGRLLRVNDKFCELTGYAREELVGRPVLELDHPEDREQERQTFKAYLQGTSAEYHNEKRYRRKDGSLCWVSVHARLVRGADGRPRFSVGTVKDITERRESQAHIARLLQQLKFHVENSPLAVIEFDTDLRITRWSWAAERVFGWRAEEVLGKGMFEIPWVHREDLERIQQVAEHLRTGRDLRNVTPNRNYRQDGSVIYCEWYNSSLLDADGRLVSILSLVLDVTARVEAQGRLRSLTERLEQLVNERTARLEETIGELRHVSYSLAHDLRAPLRAMQGFAELAERRCGQCGEVLMSEYHRRILVASRRLDLLVTDALNYTKILNQNLPLTAVALGPLIRGLLDTYPNLAPEKARVEIDGALPVVLGNESFLTQTFANLLGNAVKFVPPGRQPQVRLRTEARDGLVRIWVEDNGIGIEPHLRPRLFGMFEHLNADYEGTGMGLAIVRKAVERMGGSVGVESTPGAGSRFWVELRPA